MLVAAVNTLQNGGLPVGIVLCGLPTLQANLLNARTYTERMFRGEEIGSLDHETAIEALVRPLAGTGVRIEPACAREIVEEVSGYPYFVQLWGAELYDAAIEAGERIIDLPLLKAVRPEIYARLDRDFFEGRVAWLTPAEQDVLVASGECPYPPLRTSDLVRRTRKTPGNLNVLMGRLTEKGVLYREAKGVYQYTAPGFYEFLARRRRR
jgi:hypothetical protein